MQRAVDHACELNAEHGRNGHAVKRAVAMTPAVVGEKGKEGGKMEVVSLPFW